MPPGRWPRPVRDLRCEKPLQADDALRPLLRERQLAGHFVEPRRQHLEFIAGGDVNLVVEMTGADRGGSLSQQPDGPGHAPR